MIYFGSDLQKKIIPLFHYALNPDGILFLGNSEGIGDFGDLFNVLDRAAKIYQRREYVATTPFFAAQRSTITTSKTDTIMRQRDTRKTDIPGKLPLRELTEQALLRQLTLGGALITSDGDILYLHGSTGLYLEPSAGETGVCNILKMAREGLGRDLTSALHKAIVNQHTVHCPNVKVAINGNSSWVNFTICLVRKRSETSTEQDLWLVMLEPVQVSKSSDKISTNNTVLSTPHLEEKIEALEQELLSKDNYLEAILEELQTSNEELKSSNEEMQSVNEELQSTNEELETSREELQSLNEELATINYELQTKVVDLSQTNNDMNNLLAGTGIATVFVDLQLKILRFTPTMAQIINLIQGDVGRPVGHIVSNLKDYNLLVADVQSVLETLLPKESEVQTITGAWFTMRIRPYRTLGNIIEGAVITFVDINERKRTEVALFESEQRYHSMVSALSEGIVAHGRDHAITMWNHSAEQILGLTGAQIHGLKELDTSWHTIYEDGSPFPAHRHPSNVVLSTGIAQTNIVMGIHKPDASLTWISINAVPMFNASDPLPMSVVVSLRDITELKKTEAILHKANELLRLAVVVRDAHDAITVQNLDGHIIAWNPGAVRMYGWSEAQALTMNVSQRIPKALRKDALVKVYELSRAEILKPYSTQRITNSGAVVNVWLTATALLNEVGMMYAIATTERTCETEGSAGEPA
jgi:PAS domain S-box-containing protein